VKKTIPAILALLVIPFLSHSQATGKIAHEAFMITRMVNKFHVEPKPVDSKFSMSVFFAMLDNADPDRIYFIKSDIDRLSFYQKSLDKEILLSKTGYLTLFTNIYVARLKTTDSLADIIAKKPFDFNLPGKLTAAEDTAFSVSLTALQQKLVKKMKADVLDEMVDGVPAKFKSFTPAKQKAWIDSAEAPLRQKVASSLKRRIEDVLQNPHGVTQSIGDMYCETIASCFDPHTEFFPPEEKENFEGILGKQRFEFGFKIKADKSGGVFIDNLEPGSPAFRSGKLNKGDKFISVQWEGKDAVDVSAIPIEEFGRLLDESNHSMALFTVKKADGSLVKISLQKEQASNDDDDKVKSFILKGKNTIGYIYLPVFYEDWDTNNQGLNGCANDVGREILKLKKEGIDGLILDLRNNGGGSAEEATELAGIFIDAGPVQQEKGRDSKVFTLKDINRGTIYDGPLVVMVNGYSASASEIVAGALQDYNRAVIVGSNTYGKATAQIVFPMDTTVTPETIADKQSEDYLKITISKLFRINGTTAQFTGVHPDVVLPDLLDAYISKEADDPFALRPTTIEPNKYYTPYPPLPVKSLAQTVQTEIDTNRYFNAVKSFVAEAKARKASKDISLNLNDAIAAGQAEANDEAFSATTATKKFTVQNNQYEISRMQADSYLKELNDEFSQQILTDPYIGIAYDVLGKIKTP
jgi:carboxyl-terminal processing protease